MARSSPRDGGSSSTSDWRLARIPAGVAMRYPPNWSRIATDPGTASAALFDRRRHFLGYLNLTPQQGDETFANWAAFRVKHNSGDHDRNVRTLALGDPLRFGAGRSACIRDAYTTVSRARYIEIACLVATSRGAVVTVGAAPPSLWGRMAPILERAITSVHIS